MNFASAAILGLWPFATLEAKVFMKQDEALKIAFPEAVSVERKTLFLSPKQIEAIEKLAKSKMEYRVITYYVGRNKKEFMGYAFFESHVVRTMPETFMVVLAAEGTVRSVEMLAFYEPEDYLPPKKWLGLFDNKKLDQELWIKRGIKNITGATLTTQAITDGIRRILATFDIAIKEEKKVR